MDYTIILQGPAKLNNIIITQAPLMLRLVKLSQFCSFIDLYIF